MPTKLERLLTLLGDEKWHTQEEVVDALQIPKEKVQTITRFLADADLIIRNGETNKIKLNQKWKTLIINQKEQDIETEVQAHLENTAVGTIIVPPQKTITIQNTRITNLTDISLELEIRVDKKLKEIAINKIE
ncbi:MAG: hypothetical protein ACPLRY_02665 [Candidatus Bathyarchaeales archaeon]